MLLGPTGYAIAAILIVGSERGSKRSPLDPPHVREHIAPIAILAGALAAGIGAITIAAAALTASPAIAAFLALTLFLGATALVWSFAVDATDPSRTGGYRAACSTLVVIVLLATAALVFASASVGDASGHRAAVLPSVGAIAALMIVTAAAALVGPRIQRARTERRMLREERERAAARGELAAHLHDSVLQTLALIQTLSGATSEIARLARSQERDLRDWLFASAPAHSDDLETRFRDVVTEIEFSYPVSIDCVFVGPSIESPDALVQAAREALLNAARHAGGSISLLCEVTPTVIDIYVRDRGEGFEPDVIPPERFGVRESIIDRMSRAGGQAEIIRLATGTEVHVSMPVSSSVRSAGRLENSIEVQSPGTPKGGRDHGNHSCRCCR